MKIFDLQRFRKDQGVTQQQLAQLLSVPQSFVSQVENHKDAMPATWLDILSETYNIPDISKYMDDTQVDTILKDTSGIAGVEISISKEMERIVDILKYRDNFFEEQMKRKDTIISKAQEQIDRLITLLEKK